MLLIIFDRKGGPPATPLTVTINQAAGQADPTAISPINFTVVFSSSVSDFTTGVNLSGTAGAVSYVITGSGTTYNVAVSGMTANGTVIADIAANSAHDSFGTGNDPSTSTDNTVTFTGIPIATPTQGGSGGWVRLKTHEWHNRIRPIYPRDNTKKRRREQEAMAMMAMVMTCS